MQGQTASYIVTTLVTPPPSADLVSLKTWKSKFNVTNKDTDDFLRQTITECSHQAARHCNRIFGLASWRDTFRPQRGIWEDGVRGKTNPLTLTRWPLVTVTSVVETINGTATTLVAGTDFEIAAGSMLPGDEGPAQLYRLDANNHPRNWAADLIVVAYQTGYALPSVTGTVPAGVQPLPWDISDAVSRMVASRYLERQRDSSIAEETVFGVGTTKYFAPTTIANSGSLSPDVAEMLDRYRVPVSA